MAMITKYSFEIDNEIIKSNFNRITNQIFKLLPLREEGGDWISPLQNLILEIAGMNNLFSNQLDLLALLSKMEGLLLLTKEDDFILFRKNIFECLSILTKVKECLD